MSIKNNGTLNYRIELLGIGSAKDRQLKAHLLEAMRALSLDLPVREVRAISDILAADISAIPALLIDGKLVFQKVVPPVEDIKIVLRALFLQPCEQPDIQHIIVPTDFSETARNALCYAVELADYLGSKVRVIHIRQPKVDLQGASFTSRDHEDWDLLKTRLDATIEEVKGSNKNVVVEKELRSGFVLDELHAVSQSLNSDLIIMGTNGRTSPLSKWTGSVSSEVARRALCPVLIVPKGQSFKPFENIVYALGNQVGEGASVLDIINFACPFEAQLHFVHVERPSQNGKASEKPARFTDGLPVARLTQENILQALQNYAQRHRADLIAMSTRHRSFLEMLFHRSATRQMALESQRPLLVLHY